MPRPRLEVCGAGDEWRRNGDGKKSIKWVQGQEIFWGVGGCEEKDACGTGLDARYLPSPHSCVEGACQYKQQERTDTSWQRCIHPTICLPRIQSSFALFGVYLDIAGSLEEVAFRRLHDPQQDDMCFCSLTAHLAWPWPSTSTYRLPTSTTLANNNIYPTHGASCSTHNAASRLGHGTNLRARCFHCRYCVTELQWEMQHRRTAGGGWSWTRTRTR